MGSDREEVLTNYGIALVKAQKDYDDDFKKAHDDFQKTVRPIRAKYNESGFHDEEIYGEAIAPAKEVLETALRKATRKLQVALAQAKETLEDVS